MGSFFLWDKGKIMLFYLRHLYQDFEHTFFRSLVVMVMGMHVGCTDHPPSQVPQINETFTTPSYSEEDQDVSDFQFWQDDSNQGGRLEIEVGGATMQGGAFGGQGGAQEGGQGEMGGIPQNTRRDQDGDGVPDSDDAFPLDPNETADTDGDGIGDETDDDDDGDGVSDLEEQEYGVDCKQSNPRNADTDGDGINDRDDPYPLDPFPEFMLRGAPNGQIELYLSLRDGTFHEAILIGDPIEENGRTLGYSYFSIADFDGNGIMDFLAHSDPLIEGQETRNLYFFTRDQKADEFQRHFLGTTNELIWGVVADVNHDFRFDIISNRVNRPRGQNIRGASSTTFLNLNLPRASCVASTLPEEGCFFHRQSTLDLTSTVAGEWTTRFAFQAVNLNPQNDPHLDLTMAVYSSGGNAATRIYTLLGRGDGSFEDPQRRFVHNRQGEYAPANSLLFADFNQDGIGDVLMGFDDDGQSGQSWTYFGQGDGTFDLNPVAALDLNPNDELEDEVGGEVLGREASARTFDFDFDGKMDLIVGYHHRTYNSPGQTRFYRGQGDGTFASNYTVIGEISDASSNFAIPQSLCPSYQVIDSSTP